MNNNSTPQVQQTNNILSPDDLAALFGQTNVTSPLQAANQMAQNQQLVQNALQLYKQANQVGIGSTTSLFGPKPAGISDAQWRGMCEAWAEQMIYGHHGMYGSATSAEQHYAQNGQLNTNMSQAKPGDLVYFSDPNQPNGHVGIYNGGNNFRSATYNGIQDNDLMKWQQATGQKLLGFVRPGR